MLQPVAGLFPVGQQQNALLPGTGGAFHFQPGLRRDELPQFFGIHPLGQRRRERQPHRQMPAGRGPAQHLPQLPFGRQQPFGDAPGQSLGAGGDTAGAFRKAGKGARQSVKLVGDDAANSCRVLPLLLPGKIPGIFPLQCGGQPFPVGAAVVQAVQCLRRDMPGFAVGGKPPPQCSHRTAVVFLPAGHLVQAAPAVPFRHPVK